LPADRRRRNAANILLATENRVSAINQAETWAVGYWWWSKRGLRAERRLITWFKIQTGPKRN